MKMRLKVDGGEEIAKKLEQLSDELTVRYLGEALSDGGEIIRAEAARLAPVDTGRLRDDIKVRIEPAPADAPVAVTVGNSKKTFYAKYVELGHAVVRPGQRRVFQTTVKLGKEWSGGYVSPRPFMRPAWDSKRAEAEQAVIAHLRRRLNLT